MSVGSNLQEMENVVTKGAKPADPMPKMADPGTQLGSVEDLGGPTPENYKSDDDSAKLKDPSATLSQVKDVVNKSAGKADSMPTMAKPVKEEEDLDSEEVIEEEEITDEVISEEEIEEDEEILEEEEVVAEYDIEEDVNALLGGEELSDQFQDKARTIFETAINAKVAEIKEQITAKYEEQLVEQVAEIKVELTERVDAYLEYVADEWVKENALQIEHGLKTEMTESFLVGMKNLFEEHYVTIPEDRYDVLESMVDKLDEMESKLNEQIDKNVALNKRLAESVSDVIFAEVSEGLALSQKDKLASLAENVEFDGEESYREKLVTLRNAYFSTNSSAQRNDSETISESSEVPTPEVSGLMEAYIQTLNRVSKK